MAKKKKLHAMKVIEVKKPKVSVFEEILADPENKTIFDQLKVAINQKAHIRIDLDQLVEDEE